MLDNIIIPPIRNHLVKINTQLMEKKITPVQILVVGFGMGLFSAFLGGMQAYFFGMLFMIANRFASLLYDVSDDQHKTRFSDYMAIMTKAIFFGAAVFMIGLGQGQGLGAAFVLFSFMAFIVSDYAASEIGINYKESGSKDGGISLSPNTWIGRTEVTLYLVLIFLMPLAFAALSMFFGLLCWAVVSSRIYETMQRLQLEKMETQIEQADPTREDDSV